MSKNTASVTPLGRVQENQDVTVDVHTPAPSEEHKKSPTTTQTPEALAFSPSPTATPTATPTPTPAPLPLAKPPAGAEPQSNLDAVDTSHTKIRMMCAHKMLEKTWFVTVTTVLTMYALFGDDFRLALFDKPTDVVFYVFSLLALIVFIVELVVTGLGQPYYFQVGYGKNGLLLPSFYFFLDLAATVSLYPDVMPLFIEEDPYSVPPSADAVKAGRASRAGTRAGRIIRLVRIVRMVKLVKAVSAKDSGEIEKKADEPSAVGSKLNEVTIRKIIMIVLLSIITLPILDGSLEGAENLQHVFGLQELHRVPMDRNVSGDIPRQVFAERVRQYGRDVGKVVHIQVRLLCV